MSVATKNPFALLDDDPTSEPSPPPQSASTPAVLSPQNNNQKPRGGPGARGGRYYARGGKPQTNQTGDEPAAAADDSQRKFEGAREGGRGGRGRGGRGAGRGGRGRAYDRHSQTGRIDSDKQVNQGWGSNDGNTEFKTEQAATVDVAVESVPNDWAAAPAPAADDWAGAGADTTADPWAAPAAAAAAAVTTDPWGPPAAATDSWDAPPAVPAADNDKPEGRPRRDRDAEEDDNTLTLSQYLAQQKEKDSAIPKLENTRKANEGAGDDIWKDAVPLSKNEEEDAYFVGKSKSAPKARPKKEEKIYLEIDARFERPDRGGRGRGRGDRGGDRGDRGRGGRGGRGNARGERQNGSASVNVDDQASFPSLA